jgi:protein-disulfide isomerase
MEQTDTPPAPKDEDTITFKRTHFYSILVVLAFAVGILVGYLAWGRGPATAPAVPAPQVTNPPIVVTPAPTSSGVTGQQVMDAILPQVRHFEGDPNAPVTLIEFADFQCPYCERYYTQTQPQIDESYISAGKVRFGYWNFAFLGQESFWAAEASECASDQDAYWEYHDKLFNSQNGENQGGFSKDNLKQFAADLNLDSEAFDQCLDSGKYTSLIQQDAQTAQSYGISSTPTFLLNGTPIIGAQPFAIFQQGIENALSADNSQ